MPAYSPPFHMTDVITAHVIAIGELVGIVSVDAGLSPDPHLRRESRIRTVYSSLAIEQNTLSLDQVTDVVNGRPSPDDAGSDAGGNGPAVCLAARGNPDP